MTTTPPTMDECAEAVAFLATLDYADKYPAAEAYGRSAVILASAGQPNSADPARIVTALCAAGSGDPQTARRTLVGFARSLRKG